MAFSVVETTVANPARRPGKGKHMAKKLSAKQVKYFGTKRQKAALRSKRSGAKKSFSAHRSRSKPNPARRRFSKPKGFAKHRRRSNPGEIVSFVLGNPAKRRKGGMARRKKSFKKSHHRANPARRSTMKKAFHRRRRSNPGFIGRPMDWMKGGVGVLVGVVATRALPQAVLPSYNNGVTGYAMNAGAALAGAYATHLLTKDAVLTASVAAGGFAALIARVISDQTSFGSYLALTGVGDYQFSNFGVPQRIVAPNQAMFYGGDGSVPALGSGGSYDTGDMGRRGGYA